MQQPIRFDYIERMLVLIPALAKKLYCQFCGRAAAPPKASMTVPDAAKKQTVPERKRRPF